MAISQAVFAELKLKPNMPFKIRENESTFKIDEHFDLYMTHHPENNDWHSVPSEVLSLKDLVMEYAHIIH